MASRLGSSSVPIDRVDVSAYKVPTDSPESDGTYEWVSTTMVLVEAAEAGRRGWATRTPTRRRRGWSATCWPAS